MFGRIVFSMTTFGIAQIHCNYHTNLQFALATRDYTTYMYIVVLYSTLHTCIYRTPYYTQWLYLYFGTLSTDGDVQNIQLILQCLC